MELLRRPLGSEVEGVAVVVGGHGDGLRVAGAAGEGHAVLLDVLHVLPPPHEVAVAPPHNRRSHQLHQEQDAVQAVAQQETHLHSPPPSSPLPPAPVTHPFARPE